MLAPLLELRRCARMPKHPDNPQTHAFLLYLRICGVFLSCTRRWNGTSECPALATPSAPPRLDAQAPRLTETIPYHRLRFDVRLLQRVPYEGVSRMREQPARAPRPPDPVAQSLADSNV